MTSGFLLSLSQPTTGLQGMLPIGVKHPLGRFRGCPVRSRLAKKYIFWSVSHVQANAASLRSSSLHNIRDGIDEKQQTNEHQQIDERFRSVLHEVETIKSKYVVEEALKWYKKHIRLPRFCFYLSGILIIILSGSLPYLGTSEN